MSNFSNLFSGLVTEGITRMDKIRDAILNRHPLTINYAGPDVLPGRRMDIQPVALGLTKKGNLAFWAYVERGISKTGVPMWKLFRMDRVQDMSIDPTETFDPRNLPTFEIGKNINKSLPIVYIKVKDIETELTPEPEKMYISAREKQRRKREYQKQQAKQIEKEPIQTPPSLTPSLTPSQTSSTEPTEPTEPTIDITKPTPPKPTIPTPPKSIRPIDTKLQTIEKELKQVIDDNEREFENYRRAQDNDEKKIIISKMKELQNKRKELEKNKEELEKNIISKVTNTSNLPDDVDDLMNEALQIHKKTQYLFKKLIN